MNAPVEQRHRDEAAKAIKHFQGSNGWFQIRDEVAQLLADRDAENERLRMAYNAASDHRVMSNVRADQAEQDLTDARRALVTLYAVYQSDVPDEPDSRAWCESVRSSGEWGFVKGQVGNAHDAGVEVDYDGIRARAALKDAE